MRGIPGSVRRRRAGGEAPRIATPASPPPSKRRPPGGVASTQHRSRAISCQPARCQQRCSTSSLTAARPLAGQRSIGSMRSSWRTAAMSPRSPGTAETPPADFTGAQHGQAPQLELPPDRPVAASWRTTSSESVSWRSTTLRVGTDLRRLASAPTAGPVHRQLRRESIHGFETLKWPHLGPFR